MKMMTVDPGIRLGWCLWDVEFKVSKNPQNLYDRELRNLYDRVLCRATAFAGGSLARGSKGDYLSKMDVVVAWFERFVAQNGVEIVVCEHPEVFSSGRGAAANSSGDILKLAGLCYSLRQSVKGRVEWHFASVRLWKGQVKKQITESRIRRVWGWKGTDNNEADAVGIGDWTVRKGGGLRLGIWKSISDSLLFQTCF